MERLSDIGEIKRILSKHGFTFSKAMGQNFLINPSVCPRMAEFCGADSETEFSRLVPAWVCLQTNFAKLQKKSFL